MTGTAPRPGAGPGRQNHYWWAIVKTVLLLVVTTLSGCTTTRTISSYDLPAALQALQIGDRIAVLTADTWQEDLTVVGVADSGIDAETIWGERLTFPISQIAGIRVRASAPGKTASLAAGIFFAVLGSGIPGLSL